MPGPTHFYLSPDGDDQSAGTLDAPWRSLPSALERLRGLRAAGRLTGAARLELASGRYSIAEALELGPKDGQLTIAARTPGGAVIDGGEILSGWTETEVHGCRAWTLDLPEVAAGNWYFRSLFVNGRRAPRARFPKFCVSGEGMHNYLRIAEIRFPEKRHLFDGDNYFKPAPGDIQAWPSLVDSEIILLHYWTEARLPQPWLDERTGWVRCARRSVFNLYESYNPEPFARYYIDNLYEALTEPGEWYLDRSTGRLTYLPQPGETLRNADTEIVAPRLTRLLRARGHLFNETRAPFDPYAASLVENFHLEGLVFRHSDWFQPQTSFLPHDRLDAEDIPLGGSVQAASEIPAAVELDSAKDCSVTACAFEHIGLSGLGIGRARHCLVANNRLRDIGATGIRIWGDDLDGHPLCRTGHITISDNMVEHVGAVFHQGTGILLGPVFHCAVIHNLVAYTFYSGISVGWSWNYRETVARGNVIENNHVHHIGQSVLSDMGGIYLLGNQPGCIVRGNHIHDVSSQHYGAWGIYADEASSHLLVENNLVHDTQGCPFYTHYGREMILRNNVFAGSRQEGLIGIGRAEDHVCANIHRNIFTGPSPFFARGDYRGDLERGVFVSDANLIWFSGGDIPPSSTMKDGVRSVLSWEDWQVRLGNDRNSVIADPLFVDPAHHDYRLQKNSPALAMGFRPVDWSRCGPRGEAWPESPPKDVRLRRLAECSPRRGWPHFLNRIGAGKPVRVAYLGGSITEQEGWRIQSLAWLRKQFPSVEMEEINAALGGTGSELGVFRLRREVLTRKPDLLFVEFSLNDTETRPSLIRRAIEGIVRQTREELPECDIVFIHTLAAGDIRHLQSGRMKRSDSVIEEVADYYGIPSIHFGVEIARMEKEGSLVMASEEARMTCVSGDILNTLSAVPTDASGRILFSRDGVHPCPNTGHVLYTQALVRSLPLIQAASGKPERTSLPSPLDAGNWERAHMVFVGEDPGVQFEGDAVRLDPAGNEVARQFASRLPALWRLEPGATLRFRFRGTRIGLYGLLGPDCSAIEIAIDGRKRVVPRFDRFTTYHRLGIISAGEDLSTDSEHEILVTVLADHLDKRSVLLEKNRPDMDKFPEKYLGSRWYVGGILLLGGCRESL